jgi:dihydroorotase
MKDRALVDGARGTGRSVHTIQRMPVPELRNTELTMQAILRNGAGRGMEHTA